MKLSYLWKGLPGHPIHPPLTDATIGAYTASTVMAVASVIGVAHVSAAHGWWLALVVALIIAALVDGDLAHGLDADRDHLLPDRGAGRPLRLYARRRGDGAVHPDPGRLRLPDPRRLARRRHRLRARDAGA